MVHLRHLHHLEWRLEFFKRPFCTAAPPRAPAFSLEAKASDHSPTLHPLARAAMTSEKPTPASRRRRGSLASGTQTSVGVFCRFRPPNEREKRLSAEAAQGKGGAEIEYQPQQVLIHEGKKSSKGARNKFNLDAVFDPTSTQGAVYDAVARDMVASIVHGFNGTIFAYGQTGSGKSYSMMGPGDLVRRLGAGDVVSEEKGIIPRAVDHLFKLMQESPDTEFKVSVSYLEVYQEKISDLLVPDRANTNLKLTEYVKGRFEAANLTRQHVTSAQEVLKCLSDGDACRTIRSTDMNAVSSRSHAVLEIRVKRENADGSTKEGLLNLVDLAGSESVGKTGAEGQGLKEAQKINQSLSALSGVIKSLSDGAPHVPYRDSTLTKILMSSLGGNCKTALLLAASPSSDNVTESISTLRFGERAKKIKTAVKANEQKSQAALQKQVELQQEEIARLKAYIAELEKVVGEGGAGSVDTGELQRMATVAGVDRRTDASVGELVLLESELADEKEKQKMLDLELREAQAETQAAEAELQPYVRQAEEAVVALEKAQQDADVAAETLVQWRRNLQEQIVKIKADQEQKAQRAAETLASALADQAKEHAAQMAAMRKAWEARLDESAADELIAEMQCACEARVAKAEEQAGEKIAAHIAEGVQKEALLQQLNAQSTELDEAARKRTVEDQIAKDKADQEQKAQQAAETLESALANQAKEHAAQMAAARKAWEGRVVEPSAEDLARDAEERKAWEQRLAQEQVEKADALSSLESSQLELAASSQQLSAQQLELEEAARAREEEQRRADVAEASRDSLMRAVSAEAEDRMESAEASFKDGMEMLRQENYTCVELFRSGLAELQKAQERNTGGNSTEIVSRQADLEAGLDASLSKALQSRSAFVDTAVDRCHFGAAVKAIDSTGTQVGSIITSNDDESLQRYRSQRTAGEEPETPKVSVRWTPGLQIHDILVTTLRTATMADQVAHASTWCTMKTIWRHDGRTGCIDSAVSEDDGAVEVEWTDATHSRLPAIRLEMAAEEERKSFEDNYIVKLRTDGTDVTIPGGLTKASGIVVLEESSDGWQKALWKLGLTSIALCDPKSLSIYSHQIRVETNGKPADWVFYDRAKDHYSLSTNHGVALMESKEVSFNSSDPIVVRVKRCSFGGAASTAKEKEAWGFAGPVAFAVGKASGKMMHQRHSMTMPDGDSNGMDEDGRASASTLVTIGSLRQARREPEGECSKQKPTLGTWPPRWVRLDGAALRFFDKQGDKKQRGSTIEDVTGCIVTAGTEKFRMYGTWYLITLERRNHASLPDLQDNGHSRFCFKNEPDRDMFSVALQNVAAGRPWDVNVAGDL